MNPTVSVVMSIYNGEAYLAEAIDSILQQTFTDFEFIIVDDGSTDSSSEIVRKQTDARIQLISLDNNVGLASALNQGINQSHGQYIARMDCDDLSQPSRLQQQVNCLNEHPEICIVGSQMKVVDADKNPMFDFDVPMQHSLIMWNLFFGRTFAHPSVMMRRDKLKRVGGYDESIATAQDVDLWSRLIGQGRFANLPDKLLLYRSHQNATSIQKSTQQKIVLHKTMNRLLTQLWGDGDYDETVSRFLQIRSGKPQFTTVDVKLFELELQRLQQAMIAKGWILPDENHLIDVDRQRLLKLAEPQSKRFWNRWRK